MTDLDDLSFGSLAKQIRQDSRSTKNRLQSIIYDSVWVEEVQQAYGLPLIPNERCGLWYVNPSSITESSYFKSTDGHTTQWSFSTRRLNFHLFDIIVQNEGVIVVDSTRRGKTMPDALSKTIPIWCATLNYIMFHGALPREDNWCFLPLQIISKSEASEIIKRIPQFAQDLLNLQIITKEQLLVKFNGKYLRPIWIYPGLSLPFERPQYDEFYPVVCCVASMRADDGSKKLDGFSYVQGAADDHELWAAQLNPKLFWENVEILKNSNLSNEELSSLIGGLDGKGNGITDSLDGVVALTDKLCIGKAVGDLKQTDVEQFQTVILLSNEFRFEAQSEDKQLKHYRVPCNKKGSNELRKYLPEITKIINENFASPTLIICETGTDLSTGVALAILCLHYNTSWEEANDQIITKDVLKRHLAKLLQYKKVNPSRATLQSINSFLM